LLCGFVIVWLSYLAGWVWLFTCSYQALPCLYGCSQLPSLINAACISSTELIGKLIMAVDIQPPPTAVQLTQCPCYFLTHTAFTGSKEIGKLTMAAGAKRDALDELLDEARRAAEEGSA